MLGLASLIWSTGQFHCLSHLSDRPAVIPATPRKSAGRLRDGEPVFDDIRADLRAYGGNWAKQGFWVMVVYRFGRWRYGIRPSLVRKPFSLAYKVVFKVVQVLTGIELPCEASVGSNLRMDHFGGIVISGYARIGDDCRIGNGVVIGIRQAGEFGAPTIGNNVDIQPGAVILGEIRVGDDVIIGANTVVLTDVPDRSTAIGVPAQITPRKPRSD